jgi:outer membrane lipoprotein carrier protein
VLGALALLLGGAASGAARTLTEVCKAVEQRYNTARTLTAHFEQHYRAPARLPRAESGELALRKPARMRWDYASPPGKTFLADGKWIWFYSPQARKVERSVLKESDDLRAPLAFLLGKLDFKREFGGLTLHENESGNVIEATAKSDRLPYAQVTFTIGPDNAIRRVVVFGHDQSVMEFTFTNEKLNDAVAEARFHFAAPPNVPVVDVDMPTDEEPR